jgi:hypothetical protein
MLKMTAGKRALMLVAMVWAGLCQPAAAQQTGGGPVPGPPIDASSVDIAKAHVEAVESVRRLGLAPSSRRAADRNSAAKLGFPLRLNRNARGASGFAISNFVDLDPSGSLRDYSCSTRTYNGHGGIDLYLWPFVWWKMDQAEMEIVAANPGRIINKADGQPDRSCSMAGAPANFVIVLQDDGLYAYYWHMKSGSVTPKALGSTVQRGELLGLVASSGNSTGPHLHFELRDESGAVVDPFAGACGGTTTIWKHQWFAQRDTRLMEVASLSAPPVFPACPNPETPNYQDSFAPGATVYAAVFMRDQFPGNIATIEVVRPDDSIAMSVPTGAPSSGFYSGSYWYGTYLLPAGAPSGTWKVRGRLGTQVLEHAFFVGPAPASTAVFGSILPSGRSIQNTNTATVFASLLNAGAQTAHGCWIQPETPLDADFWFQTTNPATNQLTGTRNTSVNIPAGGLQTFMLAFTPRSTASIAQAANVALRFKCTNADAAPVFDTVNMLTLSFDSVPVPDVIPIAATPSGNGIVQLPGATGSSFFAAAAVNIGVSASLTVIPTVRPGVAAGALICETNPSTGVCLASPAPSVTRTFATNATPTFTVFVTGAGTIAADPSINRIALNFVDGGGVVRGETSVAVQTAPFDPPMVAEGSAPAALSR